ncbi:unnamed protein product [Cochlearia groenlandica]
MDFGSVNSSSVTSPVSSLNDEPHRVKFLCSFLGSILPRPQDGKLRYVGGDTRIVSVTRDIGYEELMSKMRELYDSAAVLKYKQPDEDLDALVSVVNDDDVTNMMEEYDKLGSVDGFTRLRIFLFSSPEQDGSAHFLDWDDQRESERRYVDALNNLIEGTNFMKLQQHPESPRLNLIDDFSMMDPMLNPLSVETGGCSQRSNEIPVAQYNNLHQLRIPRVGSGQMIAPRYGEAEGTWSPYYSPRHYGHHDPRTFQEFPSSPSSARYRMPYMEYPDKGFDRMPEDFVRPPQTGYHPVYEHQTQVPESVVWVPAGTMPPESKGGFPGNVLHSGPCGYDGGNLCENCRVSYHRSHQLLEQPNIGNNGFPPAHSMHGISDGVPCGVPSGVPSGMPYLDKPHVLAEEKIHMGNLVNVNPSAAAPEGAELSIDRLTFLPELMETVKRAALEGTVDVKAHPEETNDHARQELVENEPEHGKAQVEPEMDSDSDNPDNSKIEPTKAEAEALSRGLQTIRNDDLEEIRELGCGTYGSVYHGKWKGSDVAIKRIKSSCFAGKPLERERLIEDFWKEARTLSSLHHPNVLSFYGIVRDGPDGSLATVVEFMVNGSLKQFLQKKDRTIDRRKRLIIAMDTAFGMEYLHGKSIVHFDLKCENLLVNMRDPQRPICKIGDLGLSKVKQKTLVSGGVRGTLPWMAPELLSGKSNMVSEKIDVYSFGIVMWELLTGEEPYKDMHCASIIGGIVNNALRPKIPQWCDPEWKGLMESCWAAEPTERPSFADISQKLRNMAAAMNLK